jgi:ribosomal protein S27AE
VFELNNAGGESQKTMFCPKCGEKVVVGTKFCPKCGNPLPMEQPQQRKATVNEENISSEQPVHQTKIRDADNTKTPLDHFALLGFVFGCISWILNFWGIVGIIAVVFSVLGLNHRLEGIGKVIAIIGLVSGIINIIYGLSALLTL